LGWPGEDGELFCAMSACRRSNATGDRYPSAECLRRGLYNEV
jgi:hypothetical protein